MNTFVTFAALAAWTVSSGLSAEARTSILRDLRPSMIETDLTLRLGQGYNSLGGLPHSQNLANCMATGTTLPVSGQQSDSISVYVDNLTSQAEFVRQMTKNMSADLSFSPLGSGAEKANPFAASIQAKRSETDSLRYNEKYNYLFIEVRRTFETEILADFALQPQVLNFFSDRPQEFFAKCGDRFVSGYRRGAEVIGLLQCEARSSEDKHRIDQEIKVQAGYKGLSAQGEISSMIETVQNASRQGCQLWVEAQGGHAEFILSDSEKFLLNAFNYVNSAKPATARPLEFATSSYHAVLDPSFATQILDKIDLDLEGQKAFLKSTDQDLALFDAILATALPQGMPFQAVIENARRSIDALETRKSQCIRHVYDPAACKSPPSGFRWPTKTPLK